VFNIMANQPTFTDLLQKATELGEQAGKGADTQVKFLLAAVEGGYHGAVDLAKNKHGTDMDDARKLAEVYYKARTGSVIFDAKADNQQKLMSTVRTSIRLGAWPKGGNGEPLATVNNLMTIRQGLKKNPATAKKLDDAANTLMKYARAQLKRDTLMGDDELRDLCFRKTPEPATAEEIIEALTKKLDKLIDGSAAGGNAQCNSPNVLNARQALRKELSSIATTRGAAKGNGATQPAAQAGVSP
jgi:hypothetical protein